ncbi:uclacyanin 1-like [Typha latifolia]|uniref:uclacyanin 1-like n=1 Tax=Typha latifolia TaxID=4733 RepID=UPI003C2D5C17
MKGLLCITFMAALVRTTMAANYEVGGTSGWDTTTDLEGWAADIRFAPGDTLTFTYQAYHNVLEMSQSGYDSCSVVKPLGSYTGGTTTIKLTAPGKRYFICGIPGHCSLGMKLEVDVVSSATPSLPSPSPKPASTPAPMAPPPKAPHKHKHAPTKAPSPAPTPASPPPTISMPTKSPPTVSTPTESPPAFPLAPAPVTKSAAVGKGHRAGVAMGLGLGVGLLTVLAM